MLRSVRLACGEVLGLCVVEGYVSMLWNVSYLWCGVLVMCVLVMFVV